MMKNEQRCTTKGAFIWSIREDPSIINEQLGKYVAINHVYVYVLYLHSKQKLHTNALIELGMVFLLDQSLGGESRYLCVYWCHVTTHHRNMMKWVSGYL